MVPRPFALLALGALAGCVAGPNYVRPQSTAAPAGFVRAAGMDVAAPALAPWWLGLGDPVLDELERRALAGSPDIAAAEARLRGARASLRLDRANGLPSANAQLATIQARLPGLAIGESAEGGAAGGSSGESRVQFYNAGFDASWELSLFGGQQRRVEAARATAAAAEADVDSARLRLTAEVAQAYARLRDAQQRLVLTRDNVDAQKRSLTLVVQREARGAASTLDVERLRAMAEASEADRPLLVAQAESLMNALAILTGAAPGSLDDLLRPAAAIPLPPVSVAVGDPAALLQRRPDIRAAERRLAAETARIGMAQAARFPSIRLLGLVGLGGTSPSDMVDLDQLTLLAAPTLQWSFLDFGRGVARVRQAEAKRDEAEANYRGAVLAALRDAEDALSRFGQRRLAYASLARAKATADRSTRLMRQRFDAGTASMIDVLDAERTRIAAEQRLSAATADLSTDYVALQKALGLGWAPAR